MADSRPKPAKPANKTPPKSPGEPAKDKAAKRLSLEAEGAGEGAAAAGAELSALEEAFRKFAVHGDARASGREMHGKNWSKLCRAQLGARSPYPQSCAAVTTVQLYTLPLKSLAFSIIEYNI